MAPGYEIKARPTVYKGIQMRSRLEARFAQMLDSPDFPIDPEDWTYEPKCFASPQGQYLPDFRLFEHIYIEIKPKGEMARPALERMHIILASEPDAYLHVRVPNSTGGWPVEAWCEPGKNNRCHFCRRWRVD